MLRNYRFLTDIFKITGALLLHTRRDEKQVKGDLSPTTFQPQNGSSSQLKENLNSNISCIIYYSYLSREKATEVNPDRISEMVFRRRLITYIEFLPTTPVVKATPNILLCIPFNLVRLDESDVLFGQHKSSIQHHPDLHPGVVNPVSRLCESSTQKRGLDAPALLI